MTRRLLVATDLDGCLLDERDQSWKPAVQALAALHETGARLVLAGSKTRAEMEALAVDLAPVTPVWALVVENGGAVLCRHTGDVLVLGLPRARVTAALTEMLGVTGARARAFHTFSAEEMATLAGLAPEAAARALQREYDEPFVLDGGDTPAAGVLASAAAERGLALTREGGFYYLSGPHDKGHALRELREHERAVGQAVTVLALGDAPGDLSFLRAADRAIVVPRSDGRVAPELAAALPDAECAPLPGPRGWSLAVLTALRGGRLGRVREAPAAHALR